MGNFGNLGKINDFIFGKIKFWVKITKRRKKKYLLKSISF